MANHRLGLMFVLILAAASAAESIPVPNFSFEAPPVTRDEKNPFGALPFLDDWDETAVGLSDEFDQNTGVFLNSDVGAPDRILNAHLDRLGFLSSLIGNGIRQALTQTFEPGHSYRVKAAVGTSSAFGVGPTEQLEIALFYFSGNVEQIIGSTLVSGSQVGATSLIDVTVLIPPVNVGDAWANQPIGILIRPSITDPDDSAGEGFWNVDHVRLDSDDCDQDPNPGEPDFDGDGFGDACDDDIDDDGVPNDLDECDYTPLGAIVQPNGTLRSDEDGDCDVDMADFLILQQEFTGPNDDLSTLTK